MSRVFENGNLMYWINNNIYHGFNLTNAGSNGEIFQMFSASLTVKSGSKIGPNSRPNISN